MLDPDPLAAIPVTLLVLFLVQANVVPEMPGLVPRVMVVKLLPEQMV
jgi:hypothetical protein